MCILSLLCDLIYRTRWPGDFLQFSIEAGSPRGMPYSDLLAETHTHWVPSARARIHLPFPLRVSTNHNPGFQLQLQMISILGLGN